MNENSKRQHIVGRQFGGHLATSADNEAYARKVHAAQKRGSKKRGRAAHGRQPHHGQTREVVSLPASFTRYLENKDYSSVQLAITLGLDQELQDVREHAVQLLVLTLKKAIDLGHREYRAIRNIAMNYAAQWQDIERTIRECDTRDRTLWEKTLERRHTEAAERRQMKHKPHHGHGKKRKRLKVTCSEHERDKQNRRKRQQMRNAFDKDDHVHLD
jgi:hypothetical protein